MSTPLCLAPLLIHEDKLEFEVQNVFPADNVEKNRRHAKRQRAVQMLQVRYYIRCPWGVGRITSGSHAALTEMSLGEEDVHSSPATFGSSFDGRTE